MFRSVLCRSNLRFTHLPKSRYHWTRSTSNSSNAVKEYKVVLDNETLYIDQELAEALGWDATKRDSVPLTLSGWAPRYFAIARTGSDADMLARQTAESGRDPNVGTVLQYLKDR